MTFFRALCSIWRLHFCSMKITEDVRKYAAEQGIPEPEALESGVQKKAREFTERGSEIYANASAPARLGSRQSYSRNRDLRLQDVL